LSYQELYYRNSGKLLKYLLIFDLSCGTAPMAMA